ncbi:F-box protein PP2-A12 [Linum perenne]
MTEPKSPPQYHRHRCRNLQICGVGEIRGSRGGHDAMALRGPHLPLLLLPFFTSSSQISLNLHHHPNPPPQFHLNLLANSSISRSHHIKHPTKPNPDFTAKTQLTPHSYGGYSISLASNCLSFPSPTTAIPSFLPVLSSSSKIVGCRNPKCSWIHGRFDPYGADCGYRNSPRRYYSQICPPYLVSYGFGTIIGGIALSGCRKAEEGRGVSGVEVLDPATTCSLFLAFPLQSHQQPQPQMPTLGDLPESCVAPILENLDPVEICKLATLNRAFRGASWADFVWESKLLENYRTLMEKVLGIDVDGDDRGKKMSIGEGDVGFSGYVPISQQLPPKFV